MISYFTAKTSFIRNFDILITMEDNLLMREVNAVILKLKDFFATAGMKNHFTYENNIARDVHELISSHEYLTEIELFFQQGNELALPSLLDLEETFEALQRGGLLYCKDLYAISELLSASAYLYDKFAGKKEFFHLNDDALDLNPLETLRRDLDLSIEPDLTISDRASPKLKEVRSEMRTLQRRLSNIMNSYRAKYSAYLSNDLITIKGNQEVLSVKASSKGSVKGTVVSYSSTGETVYMVPYEVIDLKNRVEDLIKEEEEEVMKVLHALSVKCASQIKILRRDYEIILNFDRYVGSFRFGQSYNGCIATLSEKEFSLKSFFHPLLKAKKVITNTLSLGGEQAKTLLITGPNAGGKSVLIKAIALSIVMDKLGLYVPAQDGALIPYIDQVYFLGGDNQSVIDNLSTFSSHLLGVKEITDHCAPNSFVIIDEVGEGTSPKDGEALGVSLLKYFERVGCFTLLTSHFDGLKFYAAQDPNAQVAAMEFNNDSLKPTYRLLMNTTGKSYGLLLARQMGLKEEILKEALNYERSRNDQDVHSLMEKLTEQVSQEEKKMRELEYQKKELERLENKRQKAIDALNEEKDQIHQKAMAKVERLVQARIDEINAIWEKEGKNGSMSYSEVSRAKGELNKILQEEEKEKTIAKKEPLLSLQSGDWVQDEDGRKAKVLSVKKSEVLLDMDGINFRRPIKGLKKTVIVKAQKKKNETDPEIMRLSLMNSSQGLEINVIGLRRDEAMRKVVSFLDSARVHRYNSVRIIHGAGGFVLKDAVWQYLKNHKEFVKDYRFGGEGEGGLGATVVHLK